MIDFDKIKQSALIKYNSLDSSEANKFKADWNSYIDKLKELLSEKIDYFKKMNVLDKKNIESINMKFDNISSDCQKIKDNSSTFDFLSNSDVLFVYSNNAFNNLSIFNNEKARIVAKIDLLKDLGDESIISKVDGLKIT